MSTESTSAVVTPYTWDQGNFAWDGNSDAGKTWDNAGQSAFTFSSSDTFSTVDGIAKSYQDNMAEAFSITENTPVKSVTISRAEFLAWSETYDSSDAFNRNFGESIAVTDTKYALAAPGTFAETVGFAEVIRKTYSDFIAEAFSVADVFSSMFLIERLFNETVVFAEVRRMTLTQGAFAETLSVIDRRVTKGPVVFADLAVNGNDLSFGQFVSNAERLTPTAFNTYQPFVAGDYDLSRALIRVSLRRESDGQDLRIVKGLVYADVPDIYDKGRATITAPAPFLINVTFNRVFLTAPEVYIDNITAAVLTKPRVTNVSKTGFTLELLDASNNTPVVGSAAWTADGY